MVNVRRGFTLIELLIVVVIIGILATIAIPKFSYTKEKAYTATMKSDLRNMISAQEAYSNDYTTYSSDVSLLAPLNFTVSSGVTIDITEVVGGGWSATAASTKTPKTCAVFIGNASPVAPATKEGEVACQ